MSHTQCTGNRRSSPAGRPIGIPAERHIAGYFTPYSENTQYPRLQKSEKTEKISFSIRPWKYPERRCSLTRTIFPAIPTQFPFRKFTDFCFSTAPFALLLKRTPFSTERSINPRSWNGRLGALPPWRIADGNVNDRTRVSAQVGTYRPNPWGLFDVHGNVSEWVSTPAKDGSRMALGGSWYLPSRFSGIRAERRFTEGQPVFDVGFRVKCEP